ncbi:hypothetical protein FXW07_14370 [Methanosarcina sp. DH1]|uniref:hypothetical protein n=1 Tax=Methanosarcina sp. DH1 TaxID=2605695 RepID=UPI001E4869FC|nr:hypothetical protein [Methanosarcina sp. DH1]MCC4767754.1 hypothetical protein [Methanosarcina sp. DH1]
MGNSNCYKYRPAEGKIWSIVFNHPLRLNSNGKYGRWTRRSLKTVNPKIADGFVNEMMDLLSHKDFWKGENGKLMAEKMYSPVVASAFYDSILPEKLKDNESIPIRENLLPLPSSDDGYNKILFVGTTGAGKSTLLRQLIGTTSENFPLITTGKATVSDLEVIVAQGNYKAVVTFITKSMTELYVQDCVYSAILKALKEGEKEKIFEELSENKEQTFRLRYILGNYKDKKSNVKRSCFFDDDESDVSEKSEDFLFDVEKSNKINEYLERIIQISSQLKSIPLDEESDIEKKSENKYFDSELLYKAVYENKDFAFLVNEILDDIESRFSLIKNGVLRPIDKWPLYWEFETNNRKEFLDSLSVFYSNNCRLFGMLLTPLVQGMRVQGPFYSESLIEDFPKLVFIDGQGLGHTAESAQARSIPQKLEDMFDLVDVILLVDNSTQPMQHSTLTALKRAVASGYTNKLIIAFTHFDLVQGENFENEVDKREHVYKSLRNGLSNIEKDLGPTIIERLGSDLSERCLFLECLNKNESELRDRTLKQLRNLLKHIQKKTKLAYIVASKPQYDVDKFCDGIYSSIEKFRMKWDMRLSGIPTRNYSVPFDSQGAKKEHWARIKALNRRIAEFNIIEYDYLQPVGDLKSFESEQISRYLDESLKWEVREPSDEDKLKFIDAIKNNVSRELGESIKKEMIDELMEYWIQANNYSGMGSTKLRLRDIDLIYDQVSPLMKKSANWHECVLKIKTMVEESIDLAYEATMSKSTEIPEQPSNFIDWNVS